MIKVVYNILYAAFLYGIPSALLMASARSSLRQHALAGAQEIVSAIISDGDRFRKDAIPEDDVTLAVIKVTG